MLSMLSYTALINHATPTLSDYATTKPPANSSLALMATYAATATISANPLCPFSINPWHTRNPVCTMYTTPELVPPTPAPIAQHAFSI